MRIPIGLLTLSSLACAPAFADVVGACDMRPPSRGGANVEVWPQQLPAADYLDVVRECYSTTRYYTFEQPQSAWLDAERAAFKSALARQKVDVLVAPFQVQGYGLERTERALMSADLAYQLGGLVRVADPFLAARALGEGARRYERNDIINLARAVGARTVVIGYVGHDRAQHMTVTIETLALDPANTAAVASKTQKDWRAVAFTHVDPPFAVFHRMLPSIVADLGLAGAPQSRPRRPARIPSNLFSSFADVAADQTTIGASAGLTLLGAMATSADELARERLFERALVTSWHFDAPGDDTTFVRAYALMSLEHRPAALAALGSASSPEAVVLRALLNGNSSQATAALPSVDSALKRLLLAVQVDDLRLIYGGEEAPQAADPAAFGAAAIDWEVLVEGRARDGDPWHTDEPYAVKYLLDTVFPVDDLDVKVLLGGGLVVGRPPDDVAISLATVRHVARFVETATISVCCTEQSSRPTAWDLVGLVEGRNVSQIAKSLNRTTSMQVRLEAAGEELSRYFQVLDGHPVLAAARMDHAWRMAGTVGEAALETWRRQALENATVAAYFSGGQNRVATRAISVLGFSDPNASTFLDAYGFDYPRRAFWMEWMFTSRQQSVAQLEQDLETLRREAAAYTRSDFTPFNRLALAAVSAEARGSLAAELRDRFVGTPGQKFLLDKLVPTQPASTDPVENMRAQVAAEPDNWGARFELGRLIVERGGRYEETAEIFLAYPAFHRESPQSRVRLGNEAYDAANLFFFNGREDLAIPFFEIAAGLRAGSEADMGSRIRLDILAGRYAEAADASLARAVRYPSAYAYRDYLSFLHAFGRGGDAWDGFSQVASTFDIAQVWLSALVGQRREGRSESQIREWLKKPGIRDAKFRGNRFALRYAVLVNASDHEPPRDLGALVAELEGEPAAWIDSEGYVARPHPRDPSGIEIIRPSSFAAGVPREPEGTRVKSELTYFGAAYAAIQHGELNAAVPQLAAMAAHYPIETSDYSYALPYLAWAAAKTGDEIEFEKYVLTHGGYDVRFDFFLARAFFAAVKHKDAARARELLVNALPGHPYTDNRPVLIEYQYAQACEWLYRETGDQAFADVLLAWVKSQQAIWPTQAWPYAMEYAYSRDPERRRRALAMTLYLDPISPRLASATAAERREAEVWGQEHNPFLHETDVSGLDDIASVASTGPVAGTR